MFKNEMRGQVCENKKLNQNQGSSSSYHFILVPDEKNQQLLELQLDWSALGFSIFLSYKVIVESDLLR
jgi:hypothetical protein